MTDDRVAGLPDAGTIQPGDPGHIETHDRMAELMQFAAERIGIILDPPAPKPAVIGEYGHVQAHNDLLANIEQIAREAGTAVGGPPAPVLTNPEGGSVVAFTSGGEGAGGPTIAYGAEIEPNDHGETVTVDVTDPAVGGEVSVSGTQPFTDYIVTVYGVNVAGRGDSATTDAFQLNYNDATGGTEKIVDNYNGTTEKWRVHTFASSGTLTVKTFAEPSRVLVVGGGGNAGSNAGGGGGGGEVSDSFVEIPDGSHPVTVGQKAQDSSLGSLITAVRGSNGGSPTGGKSGNGFNGGGGSGGNNGGGGGGASAAGTTASNTQNAGTGPGGAGVATDITGSSQRLGGGGGGGGRSGWSFGSGGKDGGGAGVNDFAGRNGADNTGGGGGGGGTMSGHRGGYGGSGVVIVAYQIGTSTTREIKQAQAEAAAREAGYATGYDVGVNDGIDQRNEEIRAMTEQVKEALPTKDKK